MARPQKTPAEKRRHRLTLYLSDEELALVQSGAIRRKLSNNAWVVAAVLAVEVKEGEIVDRVFRQIIRAICRVDLMNDRLSKLLDDERDSMALFL